MARALEDLGRSLLHDASRVEYGDAVGMARDDAEIVSNENEPHASLALQVSNTQRSKPPRRIRIADSVAVEMNAVNKYLEAGHPIKGLSDGKISDPFLLCVEAEETPRIVAFRSRSVCPYYPPFLVRENRKAVYG